MTREDLKTRIKDLAEQGHRLRDRIRATSGLERHAVWNEKRALGRQARAALLAYGFLRGVPYARIEARCHPERRLRPAVLLAMWASHLGLPPIPATESRQASALLGLFDGPVPRPDVQWCEERVAAWLAATPRSSEAAVR